MTTGKSKADGQTVITIVIEKGGHTYEIPTTVDETKNFLKFALGENSLNANGSVYLPKK